MCVIAQGANFMTSTISEFLVNDVVNMQLYKFQRETTAYINMGVQKNSSPSYIMNYDGFMGLAPIYNTQGNAAQNFML